MWNSKPEPTESFVENIEELKLSYTINSKSVYI